MDPTLILVTPHVLVPAAHFTPAYYVCMYRNTFKGETMPLSQGAKVLFWGAIPEKEKLMSGIIGEVMCHERHWVEYRIKLMEMPFISIDAPPFFISPTIIILISDTSSFHR
jgi:hypothetical protein